MKTTDCGTLGIFNERPKAISINAIENYVLKHYQ